MSGLTKIEMEFYESVPHELGRIADAIAKLHGVFTCAPDKGKTPVELEPPIRDEHPTDSPFDCLAVTKVIMRITYNSAITFTRTKALVDVILNDQIQLRGLRVMDGDRGLYVAYPPDMFGHDESETAYNPITRQLKEHIENCVLQEYQAVTK